MPFSVYYYLNAQRPLPSASSEYQGCSANKKVWERMPKIALQNSFELILKQSV